MPDLASVTEVVFAAIQEFNDQMPEERKIPIATDTILFGQEGKLDSIGLVNLIAIIEEGISDQFDLDIIIADEKAMSAKTSPFRKVDVLIDYIVQRLNDNE